MGHCLLLAQPCVTFATAVFLLFTYISNNKSTFSSSPFIYLFILHPYSYMITMDLSMCRKSCIQ